MLNTSWEFFYNEQIMKALIPGTRVLDIGAGLRVYHDRGNEIDSKNEWMKEYLEKLTYHVLDPVDTYHPHIVGDIMKMSIPDKSYDVVMCLAVLEHVPRPWDAAKEMFRVLKSGGRVFCYVPFLSPYHAMPGYYGDYFRYTEEGIRSLFEDFTDINIQYVRGSLETFFHLLPKFAGKFFLQNTIARFVDSRRSSPNKQVSGYYFTAIKP